MTEKELAAEIKSGNVSGAYFFYGDEDYTKNSRINSIRQLFHDDSMGADAGYTYIAADTEEKISISDISEAVGTVSFFGTRKLVVVDLVSFDSFREDEKKRLIGLAEEEIGEDGTVLVVKVRSGGFSPGTAKRPAPFLTAASKCFKCVEFPYRPEGDLKRWMARHFEEMGMRADDRALEKMISSSGRSMYVLSNEIQKIGAYVLSSGRDTATAGDVEACGGRTDEDEAFGLANCIMTGDRSGALMRLGVKKKIHEEPVKILGSINAVFADLAAASVFISEGRDRGDFARSMKMNEYRAGKCYDAARRKNTAFFAAVMRKAAEADRKMKTGLASGGAEGRYSVIEELICSI